jgi:hypothetical protein
MLFKQVIAVYSNKHTKRTNIKYGIIDCYSMWYILLPGFKGLKVCTDDQGFKGLKYVKCDNCLQIAYTEYRLLPLREWRLLRFYHTQNKHGTCRLCVSFRRMCNYQPNVHISASRIVHVNFLLSVLNSQEAMVLKQVDNLYFHWWIWSLC